jgi:hypothetical protein
MDVDELYARHGGARKDRTCYGVWDVVEFQIQEDPWAERCNLAHRLRACRRKQLAADLEHAYKIGNLLGEFQSGR